jgi:putative spermidine/putrescine transport system permease protein
MARYNDLARDLKRAERRRRLMAIALIAPLFLFLLVSFVLPIGDMLRRSMVDTELSEVWPRTTALTKAWVWDRKSDPTPAMFRALGEDIRESAQSRTISIAARRLNYALRNGRSLVMNTGRALRSETDDPSDWRARLVEIDPAWGERATWIAIAQAAGPFTDFYLLTALDLERTANDKIAWRPPKQSLYLQVLGRTLLISVTVTVLALVLGFPVAYLVANAPKRIAGLLLILVLLPFWTSLLVRSAAWIVLLQDQGLINGALQALGIINEPVRLIFNRTGVVVAMTHVLLPFMILPMIATMKTIPPTYMRAALSLGAHPAIAFVRVYLPQTLPGVAAGVLLVFIMALGYYVTPALVGGADDQMLAHFIAFYTTSSANWGLAAALGVMLLTATAVLYLVYARLVGMGLVKLG